METYSEIDTDPNRCTDRSEVSFHAAEPVRKAWKEQIKVPVGPETYWTTQRSFFQSSVQSCSHCPKWSAAPRRFHRVNRTPGPGNYELNRDLPVGSGRFSKAQRFQGESSLTRSTSDPRPEHRNPRILEAAPVIPRSLRPWQQTPKESPGPTSFWNTQRDGKTRSIQANGGFKFGSAVRDLTLRSNLM